MSISGEQARERILDAAFGEIRLKGFQAAGISAILAQTGLTKGALYHYFPSKKELGLAVVDERVSAALKTGILDALAVAENGPDPVAGLLAQLDAVQCWTEDSVRLGCPLNNLMQEMSAVDEDFRAHLNAVLTLWQVRVASLLRVAAGKGQLKPAVDCDAAALFIVAAWEGCVSIAKNLRSMPVFVASVEQLKRYVQSLRE